MAPLGWKFRLLHKPLSSLPRYSDEKIDDPNRFFPQILWRVTIANTNIGDPKTNRHYSSVKLTWTWNWAMALFFFCLPSLAHNRSRPRVYAYDRNHAVGSECCTQSATNDTVTTGVVYTLDFRQADCNTASRWVPHWRLWWSSWDAAAMWCS